MRKMLTDITHIKIMSLKGGVRLALRAQRTPPLRAVDTTRHRFCSLWVSVCMNKNIVVAFMANLNGILYQNYTADLYQFKNAVDKGVVSLDFVWISMWISCV